jgi:hypothetical protein
MPLSQFAKTEVLELVFGQRDFGGRSATKTDNKLYLGLATANPANDDTELPTSNNYQRVEVANDSTTWGVATGTTTKSVTNLIQIPFAAATGSTWPTVSHFQLFDAASGGNVIAYGPLAVDKTIGVGDTASFAPGSLVFTLS